MPDQPSADQPLSDQPADLDLSAAWLRRAHGDLRPFMAALARRLGDALPGRVDTERRRDGFFSSTSHVHRIAVRLDPDVFVLEQDAGVLQARRTKLVRNVALRSDPMDVPAWLRAVTDGIGHLAGDAEAARAALPDILLG